MSNNSTVFPVQNKAFRIPLIFRDTSGNLITGWTGAASSITVDGASIVSGNAPVEVSSSGLGYLDLTAAQMNGQLIEVKCTITNSNAVTACIAIYTYPQWSTGNGTGTANTYTPTDPIGRLMWMFLYFFRGGSFTRSTGVQTVLDDTGATLTSIQTSGTDIEFNKFSSSP